jgi:hypothetical protein
MPIFELQKFAHFKLVQNSVKLSSVLNLSLGSFGIAEAIIRNAGKLQEDF